MARGRLEELPFKQFFKELDATDEAERFRNLRRVTESTLSDVRVLRAGSGKGSAKGDAITSVGSDRVPLRPSYERMFGTKPQYNLSRH